MKFQKGDAQKRTPLLHCLTNHIPNRIRRVPLHLRRGMGVGTDYVPQAVPSGVLLPRRRSRAALYSVPQ